MITTGNYLKTAILMAGLTFLMMGCGYLLGGREMALVALIISLVINLGTYWFSDKLVLSMYHAQPVSDRQAPQLHRIVNRLCRQANLPKPKLYILPEQAPNAFATGRNPRHSAVAVTQGLLSMMSEDEVAGVVAHELAHIKNRDILICTITASFVGAISFLATMAQWTLLFGGHSRSRSSGGNPLAILGVLLVIILGPIAGALAQMAISRSREYGADATGASFAGSPKGLANALRKLDSYSKQIPFEASPATNHMFIVKPLSSNQLSRWTSTHPPMEERIRRLLGHRTP